MNALAKPVMDSPVTHNEDTGLNLVLGQHKIGFLVPEGMKLKGAETMVVGHGVLVAGELDADIVCTSGSVIVAATGTLRGNVNADNVYVSGRIEHVTDEEGNKRKPNILAKKLFASSATAVINADLTAFAYAIHRSKINGKMENLESE